MVHSKVILGVSSGFFAILAATATVFANMTTKDELGGIRGHARRAWQSIDQNGLTKLPERVIQSFTNSCRARLSSFTKRLAEVDKSGPIFAGSFFFSCTALGLLQQWEALSVVLVSFIIWVGLFLSMGEKLPEGLKSKEFYELVLMIVVLFTLTIPVGSLTYSCLSVPSPTASAALMLLLLPILSLTFAFIWGTIGESYQFATGKNFAALSTYRFVQSFSVAASITFFITLFSLAIGNLAAPDDHMPRTVQMLIANVLCDGLSLAITLQILETACKRNTFIAIPIATILDLAVSAMLACASLWLGIIGTQAALSPTEVFNILIARTPEGDTWSIGPYFWVLHTVFIPTLIYLFIIVMAWGGKLLFAIVRFFSKRLGHKDINPFAMTAALFALIAVLFAGMATTAGFFEEDAKSRAKQSQVEAESQGNFDKNL